MIDEVWFRVELVRTQRASPIAASADGGGASPAKPGMPMGGNPGGGAICAIMGGAPIGGIGGAGAAIAAGDMKPAMKSGIGLL